MNCSSISTVLELPEYMKDGASCNIEGQGTWWQHLSNRIVFCVSLWSLLSTFLCYSLFT